ncbi:SpoIIE family protein phosphatase [Streptomyces sp. NPDC018031]|uniref:SpoIIE family protein phosphatase n=1 Tax=Streptomyces sp. NPDC018031 TaxID=3365033 RepID=UPI0037B53CD0
MGSGRRDEARHTGPGRHPASVGWSRARTFLADRAGMHRRLAWLMGASARVGTTLDLGTTAQELADYAVPSFADACSVDLLESVLRGEESDLWRGPGPPERRAMAVAFVAALEMLEPDPVGEIAGAPATRLSSRCLTTGQPILLERMSGTELGWMTTTPSAARALADAKVHSLIIVPLIARGVLLGVVDFLRAGRRPGFTRTDLSLAMRFAAEAALFIDNARLYGQKREALLNLQRALLPRSTPATPGLTVTTSYRAPRDASGVGGDWFDVIALPGGRTALVVGDVMAHGLAAAATMGRLRTVARTLMTQDIAPERVLARMDVAARDLEEDQVATCLICVYDPADAGYTVATAGNLTPLLAHADGTTAFPEVPRGAPLGAGAIPYDAVRLSAPEGSTLVLYTDGLLKARARDIDTQRARLLAAAAALAPLDADTLADTDIRGAERFDEAVVVCARRPTAPQRFAARVWDLPAEGTAAGLARTLLREQLGSWQLQELADTGELVVSELVGNALRHGDGPRQLRVVRHDRLTIEVSDTGPDLPQIQHATLDAEGGRGLQLINLLSRRWGSCRTPAGKVVWAEHDLPAPDGDPAAAAAPGPEE